MPHEYEIGLYRSVLSTDAERSLPQFGSPSIRICTVDDLAIYSQVGEEMGIEVRQLQGEGETYDHVYTSGDDDEPFGGESIRFSRRVVPEGHVRVEIGNEIRRMGDFYTRVDALSQQLQTPSEPSN